MNQLNCPHCGWRNLTEFRYGGELLRRPDSEGLTTAELANYLYSRRNPLGYLNEWWYHRLGCGAWFIAERHTKTHAIRRTWIGSEPRDG